MQNDDVLSELDRVGRVAPFLNDPHSQQALRQYSRELEAERASAPVMWQICRIAEAEGSEASRPESEASAVQAR